MSVRSLSLSLRLPALVLVGGLALSACGGSPGDDAPAPVEALPAPVQTLAVATDVGQFFVTPEQGTAQTDIDETIAKLKSMEGVETAQVIDGNVDLVLRPFATPEQREAAIRQLGALGDVQEGI